MLVTVNDARVVAPANQQFGEIFVTTKPTRAGDASWRHVHQELRRDADRAVVHHRRSTDEVPAANVGDKLERRHDRSGRLVDLRRLHASPPPTLGTVRRQRPRRATTAAHRRTTSWPSRRTTSRTSTPRTRRRSSTRLAAGIVDNLQSPDIVALEEIQDNNGADERRHGRRRPDARTSSSPRSRRRAARRTSGARSTPSTTRTAASRAATSASAFLFNPTAADVRRPAGGDATTAVACSRTDGKAALTLSPGPGRPGERGLDEQPQAARRRVRASAAARSSSSPTTSTPRAATRALTARSSRRAGPRRSSGTLQAHGRSTTSSRSILDGRPERQRRRRSATSTTSSSPTPIDDAHRRRRRADRPDHDAAEQRALHATSSRATRRCSTTSS